MAHDLGLYHRFNRLTGTIKLFSAVVKYLKVILRIQNLI